MSTNAIERFAVFARGVGYFAFGASVAQMAIGNHVADIALMTISAFSFAVALHTAVTAIRRRIADVAEILDRKTPKSAH